jgi:hypothetical protein
MDDPKEAPEPLTPVAPLDELSAEELKRVAGGQDGSAHAKQR